MRQNLAAVILLAAAACGSRGDATVDGVVYQEGVPVSGAVVSLGGLDEVTTGSHGTFEFVGEADVTDQLEVLLEEPGVGQVVLYQDVWTASGVSVDLTLPSWISLEEVDFNSHSISLRWSAVEPVGFIDYQVHREMGKADEIIPEVTNTSVTLFETEDVKVTAATLKDLDPDTRYELLVTARGEHVGGERVDGWYEILSNRIWASTSPE